MWDTRGVWGILEELGDTRGVWGILEEVGDARGVWEILEEMKPLEAIFVVTVAALCLSRCSPFSLTVTPSKVKVGDEVVLGCFGEKNDSPSIVKVLWIRVVRLAGRTWSRLAEHREKDSCVITYGEISADDVAVASEVGGWNGTYLTIKWKAAREPIYGTYRCDVIGVNENEDVVVHSTDRVTIDSGLECSDYDDDKEILQLLKSRSEELSILIKSVQEKQLSLSAEVNRLHAKMSQNKTSDASMVKPANVASHVDNDEITELPGFNLSSAIQNFNDWPAGSYSLLTSGGTDCPDSSGNFEWTKTFFGFVMEMDSVTDVVGQSSPRFRSLYDITTSRSLNLTLCQANKTLGPDWPTGTYCINRHGAECPSGFRSGFLRLTEARNNHADNLRLLHFCCRSDGRHTVPIRLPISSPFYLLRHGGKCQAVSGMTFELGQFVIDTKNSENLDSYENSNHPDGQLNDVIVHACYYEQDKQ
ncbi:hypothetical protein Btru_043927 [Bulinus truncatus]|nr:hypothetical protein Btru_043927 [Bulinus truncatus]